MDVAVIIPLFNGADWIEETLNSVYSQEQAPAEVIVVDDGSTDASPRIVSGRFSTTILLANKGKGSSHARNVGIENSCSPLLAFLDQDDLWHKSHLKMLNEIYASNPSVNCVVASADCFSEMAPSYSPMPQPAGFFDPWDRFPFTMGIEGPSVALFRRDFLTSAGLWQVEGTGMGDILLFLKATSCAPLLRTPAITVGKRVHAHQQWLSVRKAVGTYMKQRISVTRLALDYRKAAKHDLASEKVLERRWKALQQIAALAEVEHNGDLNAVTGIADRLENLLDEQVCRHAFYCLMGALFPVHDVDQLRELRDKQFTKLLDKWPKNARMTRNAIESLIGEQPVVS